jgi:hypothetical protein
MIMSGVTAGMEDFVGFQRKKGLEEWNWFK